MISIYTDGGCRLSQQGVGGWATVVYSPGSEPVKMSGSELNTTNNRMEILGMIKALEWVDLHDTGKEPVRIYSDSQYVLNGTQSWIKKWRKNGWKTGSGAVKNRELWEQILVYMDKFGDIISFEWIKGHAGIEGNEMCDLLCNEEMDKKLGVLPKVPKLKASISVNEDLTNTQKIRAACLKKLTKDELIRIVLKLESK